MPALRPTGSSGLYPFHCFGVSNGWKPLNHHLCHQIFFLFKVQDDISASSLRRSILPLINVCMQKYKISFIFKREFKLLSHILLTVLCLTVLCLGRCTIKRQGVCWFSLGLSFWWIPPCWQSIHDCSSYNLFDIGFSLLFDAAEETKSYYITSNVFLCSCCMG